MGMRFFFFIFSVFLVSCVSQKKTIKSGVIRHTLKFYDSIAKQYNKEIVFPDFTVWYKDNLFIEEIKTVETYRDTSGIITRKTPLAYYLFIDRASKSFYHYSSFSDTAKILDRYFLSDTAAMRGVGGWPFYQDWGLDIQGPQKLMTDTVIKEVSFKRVLLPIKSNSFFVEVVVYQRCDKTETIFMFDRNLSAKLGCPITRIDFLPSSVDPEPLSDEIHFLRNKLTSDELKVFNAWERNLKRYPVK